MGLAERNFCSWHCSRYCEMNDLKLHISGDFRIGAVRPDNITVLAPLAGITNLPFRLSAKKAGCGLVCSEMASSNGIVYNSGKTLKMLETHPEERPVSVQIFGADPAIMADAAAVVESFGADILDINFGCSVRKVVKTGSGAALMRDPERAGAVISAVRKAVAIPLTVKIRTGWDRSGDQAIGIAQIAETCGADAVAVHPRTATQAFSGNADWSVIAAVKKRVSIPVIGNGDIVSPEDAIRMISETGCDAVMIGRAAIGRPWIFTRILAALDGKQIPEPTAFERFAAMRAYLTASVAYLGEKHACPMMRSRLGWFVKGLPNASAFRESVKRISTEAEAMALIDAYHRSVDSAIAGTERNACCGYRISN